MVRTFLKVYMEFSSYFLFLQEQIKDIIIVNTARRHANQMHQYQLLHLSTKLASGVSGILCDSRVGQRGSSDLSIKSYPYLSNQQAAVPPHLPVMHTREHKRTRTRTRS